MVEEWFDGAVGGLRIAERELEGWVDWVDGSVEVVWSHALD